MRKVISFLNLVVAIGMAGLMILAVASSHTFQTILQFVACLIWTFFAVRLLRSQRLWPWIGSLIFVSAATLIFGAQMLRFFSLAWRAEYGDRSVVLDPSTIGIPLFCSGLLTAATLALLLSLLSLPAWSFKKGADA